MNKKQIVLLPILLLLVTKNQIHAQELKYIEVKGQIVDELYQPIPFVHIISKSTGFGKICDNEGKFRFKILNTDTLMFSAVSYIKTNVAVKDLPLDNNIIKLENNIYEVGEVNVMGLRWQEFKYQVMNKQLDREDRNVLVLKGLPDPFQKKIDLGPYAGNSNPISLLLMYFQKENVQKRKRKRWHETYKKTWILKE